MLDTGLIHRAHDTVHTCLLGKGDRSRQASLAYFESDLVVGRAPVRSLLILGPGTDRPPLIAETAAESKKLRGLVEVANSFILPRRPRPILDATPLPSFLSHNQAPRSTDKTEGPQLTFATGGATPDEHDAYRTIDWNYQKWVAPESPLTTIQRKILLSDVILRQPMRIVGPAGSGKSLVMQLLAMRRLIAAEEVGRPVHILYATHNMAMASSVTEKFKTLGAERFVDPDSPRKLLVRTLSDFSRGWLELRCLRGYRPRRRSDEGIPKERRPRLS